MTQQKTDTSHQSPVTRVWCLVSGVLCLFIFFLAAAPAHAYQPTSEEKQFLLQIQQDTAKYFVKHADPKTGLVRDSSRPGSPASIASTGFGLAVWAIAKDHGWMSYKESYERTLTCLRTLRDKAEHKNGFFYHMLSVHSGKRVWSSEASSIDTALLLAGALFAGEAFKGTEIEKIARELYERVDWTWMMNRTLLLCHGWKPESGFLPYYWDMYSEHLILQALALGSPTHPSPIESWNEWTRDEDEYNGKRVVYSYSGSLFTYQYSQAFIDFRQLWDRDINYFENSRSATRINQEFCLDNLAAYKTYSPVNWGLSACLGPKGYKAYGAPPGKALHDGTIAIHAAGGSLPFEPELTIKTLQHFYESQKEKLYSPIGFKDSFNLEVSWWANEHLGIDQGIMILAIENFLWGTVWEKFMKLKAIENWVRLCKLRPNGPPPELRSSSFSPSESVRLRYPNY